MTPQQQCWHDRQKLRRGFAVALLITFVVAGLVALAMSPPAGHTSATYSQTHESARLDALSRVVAQVQYGFDLPRMANPHGPIIVRELYVYRANAKTRQPDWIAFDVRAERFVGDVPKRARNWKNATCIDPDFVLDARPDDFGTSDQTRAADRGHANPLKSVSGHPAWATSNEYGNIIIESPGANRGPILRVEERCRDLARDGARPFCVILPVWNHPDVDADQTPELPNADEFYSSPEAIAYVVRFPRGSAMADSTYCYVIPQTARQTDPASKFATTLDNVEQLTGAEL